MKRTTNRAGQAFPYFFFFLAFSCCFQLTLAQHLIATYSTSAPEATMFFLDPGYLSPAFGNGALGMHSNPAGLHVVEKNELSVAFSTAQSSSADFSYQAAEASEVYNEMSLDTQFKINEPGGLGALAAAHRRGNWVWGVEVMQARKSGISLEAQGTLDVTTRYSLFTPITRAVAPSLPVNDIPMIWNINTIGQVKLRSKPAELSIAIQPIIGGFSYQKGHFALGAGLTYFAVSSNDAVGEINSEIDIGSTVIGRPYDIDPVSGQAWRGSVRADVDIYDQPFSMRYGVDLTGHWFALSLGGMMNYKLLSIGATYTHGFEETVRGSYHLMTITTTGIPEEDLLSNVNLDLSLSPEIHGHATLTLRDFAKDTLISRESGALKIGGYNSFSVGAHFLIFGAFFGADIPKFNPDVYSISFGAYTEFPIPKLPIRFNAGIISRSDGIIDGSNAMVPFRLVSHIGGGVAFKLPTHEWLGIGTTHSRLRIGLRSSLTSYIIDLVESKAKETTSKSTPQLSTMAFSFGLAVPF